MFIVAVFIFALMHVAPGGPDAYLLSDQATEAERDELRKALGLDRSVPVQLGIWIKNIGMGDLGTSHFSGKPVLGLLIYRAAPTVALALMIEIFAILIGLPLGVIAAWTRGTVTDRVIMAFASFGFSVPGFFLGFLLIRLFALELGFFPAAGYVPPGENLGLFFKHLILPSISAGLIVMALITRMTRASMLEVLQEDYVRTARSKGLSERLVLSRHALRNASLPIVTVIGIGFAGLLGGLVVIEQVFAIPGLGRLMTESIVKRDYPVIQGAIIVTSAIFVYINLFIDILYAFLDPRIKYR